MQQERWSAKKFQMWMSTFNPRTVNFVIPLIKIVVYSKLLSEHDVVRELQREFVSCNDRSHNHSLADYVKVFMLMLKRKTVKGRGKAKKFLIYEEIAERLKL